MYGDDLASPTVRREVLEARRTAYAVHTRRAVLVACGLVFVGFVVWLATTNAICRGSEVTPFDRQDDPACHAATQAALDAWAHAQDVCGPEHAGVYK